MLLYLPGTTKKIHYFSVDTHAVPMNHRISGFGREGNRRRDNRGGNAKGGELSWRGNATTSDQSEAAGAEPRWKGAVEARVI